MAMRRYQEIVLNVLLIAITTVEILFVKSFHYRIICILLVGLPAVMYVGIIEYLLRDDIKTNYPNLTKQYPELLYVSLHVVLRRMNKKELPFELASKVKRYTTQVTIISFWIVFQVLSLVLF